MALAEGGEVDRHGMGEKGGADGAVGGGVGAADGSGEAMDNSESGVGEGEASKERGEGHVGARREITAVLTGAEQRGGHAGESVLAKGIGEGVGAEGDERLDQLGEGVEAGLGGDGRGEGEGEFRIDECGMREEEGAAEAGFDAVFAGGKDGIAGDFGAGPGSGGNGDPGSGRAGEGLGASDHFQIVVEVALIGKETGDGLGGIEGAAAAETDDDVEAAESGPCYAGGDMKGGGFAGDGEGVGGDTLGGQGFEDGPGAGRLGTGDDKGAFAELAGDPADMADRAWTKDDAGGGSEVEGSQARDRGRITSRRHGGTRNGSGCCGGVRP